MSAPSRSFALVRFLARVMLRSQYRRIEVAGAEQVPATGAVMIVANHFSSLVDSMALLHAAPRPASFLAKAPLWNNPVLAFLLDAVEAVPVWRPQDVAQNQGRTARANLATFEACRERLRAGGSIALFPEGVSQPGPHLMPVRTGAARIALDAGVPVTVCPAGLVYEPMAQGRRGTLLVCFGPSFVVGGWEAHASRRAGIAAVTRRIEASLRELLAETDSHADLEALTTLRMVWEQERDVRPARTLAEAHERNRLFARGLARLEAAAPEEVDALRAEADVYRRALELARVLPERLRGGYTAGRVLRFVLLRLPLVLLAAPFALVAGLVTWPFRHAGDIVALRRFGGREDVRALCRMVGGSIMLVLGMVGGGLLALLLWGPGAGLAVFLGLPAMLACYLAWRDHLHVARARVRSFFLLAGSQLRRTLLEHRRALFTRLVRARGHLREGGQAPG